MKLEAYEYGFKDTSGSCLTFHQGETRKNLFLSLNELTLKYSTCNKADVQMAEHGGPVPTHVLVRISQYSGNPVVQYIPVANLEHIRTVNGGIRFRNNDLKKQCGTDCKSHTYSLFMDNSHIEGAYAHPEVVIAVSHGAGISFLKLKSSHADESFKYIAAMLQDGEFYDVLHVIVKAFTDGREQGESEATHKYERAFVEGRLKKRRRNKRIYVEIDTEMQPKVALI